MSQSYFDVFTYAVSLLLSRADASRCGDLRGCASIPSVLMMREGAFGGESALKHAVNFPPCFAHRAKHTLFYWLLVFWVLYPHSTVNPTLCRSCTSLSASRDRRGWRRSVNAGVTEHNNTLTCHRRLGRCRTGCACVRARKRRACCCGRWRFCCSCCYCGPPVSCSYGITVIQKHSRSRTHSNRGEGM